MLRSGKADKALGLITDLSLVFCMFAESAIPHTRISQAGLLLFFLCTGIWMVARKRLAFSWWMVISALVIVWSTIVSFGWAFDRAVSLSMVQTLIITAAFFFFLYQYLMLRKDMRKYLAVYVLSTLLVIGYLFCLEHSLDWSKARLGLTHGVHPNLVGMLSAFAFGACITLIGEKKRLLWLIPIPFLLIAVALTMSVKSMALSGLLLVALLLIRYPKRWGLKLAILIVGGLAVFYVLVLTDNPLSRGVLHRVRDVAIFIVRGEGMGGSMTERVSLMQAAWDWFSQRPIRGWGLGCFRLLHTSLGVYSHNNYTELLVSGGIPMALIYYAGQIGAFVYAARAIKRAKSNDPTNQRTQEYRLVAVFCVLLVARFILDVAVVSYFERQDAVFAILLIAASLLLMTESARDEKRMETSCD